MKSVRQIIVISIVLGFGLFGNLEALNQAHKNAEATIWELEERYWDCWIKEDMEGYMSLLHEDFMGWASSLETPGDKKAAREFVQNFWSQIKLFAFEMKPCTIRIIDDVALVHYFLLWKDENGNQIGNSYRITHTWLKQAGIWQILGGMSSEIKTEQEEER
jgi:ketosteroid isomerase-like protein